MSGRMTHHAGGLVAGLTVGQFGIAAGWPTTQAVGFAAIAALTAGGELSPDADQRRWFRRLDKIIPDELLGNGGPLQHRGITHWVGMPALIAAGWLSLLAVGPAGLGRAWWLGWAVAVGWASHVVLDAVYGHAVRAPSGAIIVRAGVPTMPWWRHRGGVWTSSGPGSQVAGALLGLAGCIWAFALIGGN